MQLFCDKLQRVLPSRHDSSFQVRIPTMPPALSFLGAVLRVTIMALVGMLLGGLFGWGAGVLTPSFFARIQPWSQVEPQGFAVVLGAFSGVLCGGALGVFALILELVALRSGFLHSNPEQSRISS